MAKSVNRFLGGSPLRVVFKLVVASFIVGFLMSFFGWHPRDIYGAIANLFSQLWNRGFQALADSAEYLLLGAAIVVPLFLVIRLLSFRSRSGTHE